MHSSCKDHAYLGNISYLYKLTAHYSYSLTTVPKVRHLKCEVCMLIAIGRSCESMHDNELTTLSHFFLCVTCAYVQHINCKILLVE